jgi:hypothetical protein
MKQPTNQTNKQTNKQQTEKNKLLLNAAVSLRNSKPFSRARTFFTFRNTLTLISDIQQIVTGLHSESN